MGFTNSRRKQRGTCRVEQPPERGIIDAVREWVSTWSTQQREVYRVEQPPERGIVDAAREWVSTRSRRISAVDGVRHQTAQLPTANAASSSTARCLKVVGVVCHLLEATGICCALLVPTRIIFSAVEALKLFAVYRQNWATSCVEKP
nr:hypothetical protein Itr_chr02CG11240 [Ipomoea trifida]